MDYGDAAKAIIDYAGKHAIDTIVMGTRGAHGLEHILLGIDHLTGDGHGRLIEADLGTGVVGVADGGAGDLDGVADGAGASPRGAPGVPEDRPPGCPARRPRA